MIFPSIYPYKAPFRGPKVKNEINKLFSSVVHDISIVYNELEKKSAVIPDNLKFQMMSDRIPLTNVPTVRAIENEVYIYKGVDNLANSLNGMSMRIEHILENL